MARWLIEPQDIAPLMGMMAAQAWQMHVKGEDPESIVREYSYRIEAGSARKPNKATEVEQVQQAMQVLMPVAQGLLQSGNPTVFNALMEDFGRANDIDVSRYIIPPPPPPPPGPPPGQQPPPEGPPPPEGQ